MSKRYLKPAARRKPKPRRQNWRRDQRLFIRAMVRHQKRRDRPSPEATDEEQCHAP